MAGKDTHTDLKALTTITQAAKQLGLDVVRIDATSPSKDALQLVPEKLAREFRLLPVRRDGNTLMLALSDPSLLSKPAPVFLQDLKKKQGYQLKLLLTPPSDLASALAAYDAGSTKDAPSPQVPPSDEQADVSNPVPSPTNASLSKSQGNSSAVINTRPVATPVSVPAAVQSTKLPSIDLSNSTIPREVIESFPEEVARKYRMVVFQLSQDGKEASVAILKPKDKTVREILKYVEDRNNVRVKLFKTTPASLDAALKQYRQSAVAASPTPQAAREHKVTMQDQPAQSQGDAIDSQRATMDKVRAEAQTRTKPGREKQTQPLQDASSYQSASQYQQSVTTPKISSAAVQPPKRGETVPSVVLSELKSQPGLSQPAIQQEVVASDKGQNLDAVIGSPVTDEASFEQVVKSGLVPKIVAALVSYAVGLQASDIHIEAGEEFVRVRYRIDGRLQDIIRLPVELHAPLLSRIKILSELKIDETRLPQDGRFNVVAGGKEIDLRVSTLPTVHGEKAVLRILDKSSGIKQLRDLGLHGRSLERVTRALKDPYGISLVTGPTGSGKTTTLYAMLNILNRPEVNIITIEDPVEYEINGINQTQVKPKIGLTFADGLRSILRQDPDVIMVGEIRDKETAELATQAALTGHLVLSTLHTNDAAGAIPRMVDMEVEPFLIASSVDVVIAQRLVRRLCQDCKVEVQVPDETISDLKQTLEQSSEKDVQAAAAQPMKFWTAKGCEKCQDGYKGRIAIYEVLEMSDAMTELVSKKASTDEIDALALKEGMVTMKQDGILKALSGVTTIDEVLQATAG